MLVEPTLNETTMNIEDYREYCLSLGDDVEEKLPFTAFHYASGVLVFFVKAKYPATSRAKAKKS